MKILYRLLKIFFPKWKIEVKPLTKESVKNFFFSYYRYIFAGDWAERQAEYRRKGIEKNSPGCLTNDDNVCLHCGCNFPAKLYETDECEDGCYGVWMNKWEWILFENKLDNLDKSDK